ncbi:MAG: hemerythrin domain-containing protein [Acidimicrobiales bacterium]
MHDAHRRATSMLADALDRATRPDVVADLRDFVVAMLVHHHRCEDDDLWPLLEAADPNLAPALDALSEEHGSLDAALERLGAAPVAGLADTAAQRAVAAVRVLVHEHLDHEEPILLPALRAHVSDRAWAEFSARTVASAPQEGAHLFVGLLHEVGAPDDVELIVRHLPPDAQAAVPAMRDQARSTFVALRTAPPAAGRRHRPGRQGSNASSSPMELHR